MKGEESLFALLADVLYMGVKIPDAFPSLRRNRWNRANVLLKANGNRHVLLEMKKGADCVSFSSIACTCAEACRVQKLLARLDGIENSSFVPYFCLIDGVCEGLQSNCRIFNRITHRNLPLHVEF